MIWANTTTSANHGGVEGAESGVIWMERKIASYYEGVLLVWNNFEKRFLFYGGIFSPLLPVFLS